MFVDDDQFDETDTLYVASETDARQLLVACAAEAERQAAGMRKLDAALGAAVTMARESTNASGLVMALMRDLQKADLMRQEMEGLSRALALLVSVPAMHSVLPARSICACTPLLTMQQRLLRAEGLVQT